MDPSSFTPPKPADGEQGIEAAEEAQNRSPSEGSEGKRSRKTSSKRSHEPTSTESGQRSRVNSTTSEKSVRSQRRASKASLAGSARAAHERDNAPCGLKTVNRLLTWPMVEATVNVTSAAYDRVKGSNWLFKLSLGVTETAFYAAAGVTSVVSRPFMAPISLVDTVMDYGLNIVEEKAAIVKDTPDVALEKTISVAQPTIDKVKHATVFVKDKVNVALRTRVGYTAVEHVADNVLKVGDTVITYFIRDPYKTNKVITPLDEDPVMHMVNQVEITAEKIVHAVLATPAS